MDPQWLSWLSESLRLLRSHMPGLFCTACFLDRTECSQNKTQVKTNLLASCNWAGQIECTLIPLIPNPLGLCTSSTLETCWLLNQTRAWKKFDTLKWNTDKGRPNLCWRVLLGRNGENWKEGVNRWDNQRDTKLGHSRLHKRRPHSRTGPAKASYYYSRSAVISSALLNLRLCQSLENTWLERKSLESMGKCSRASTSFDIKGWPAQGWNRQARQAGRFLKKVDQTLLTVNMNMTWNRGFGNGCTTCTSVCLFC